MVDIVESLVVPIMTMGGSEDEPKPDIESTINVASVKLSSHGEETDVLAAVPEIDCDASTCVL